MRITGLQTGGVTSGITSGAKPFSTACPEREVFVMESPEFLLSCAVLLSPTNSSLDESRILFQNLPHDVTLPDIINRRVKN